MPYYIDKQRERDVIEALRKVADAEEICRQGAAAGYDMTAQDMACQYYRQRLEAVRQHLARPGGE
jgi:hypothetical protein